jgi:hypothetical protein
MKYMALSMLLVVMLAVLSIAKTGPFLTIQGDDSVYVITDKASSTSWTLRPASKWEVASYRIKKWYYDFTSGGQPQ